MLRLFFLIAASCFLTANAESIPPESPSECVKMGGTWTTNRLSENAYCYAENQQSCNTKDGNLERVCMSQSLMCVTRTPDAGNPCTDSRKCSIACLYRGPLPKTATESIQGQCQETNDPCGCRLTVIAGKLGEERCSD